MRKLCILLTDPMQVYYQKGEIKPRYYNPGDIFDEVHMLSFCNRDIAEEKVRQIAGRAKLKIHSLGRLSFLSGFTLLGRLTRTVQAIAPDVLRAYDPSLRGALAVYLGKKLQLPVVLSIHANLDEQRAVERRPFLWIRLFLERYALQGADEVICVSAHVQSYVRRLRTARSVVIYNRISNEQFGKIKPHPADKKNRVVILTVGRVESPKNQECLIRAISGLDARLISIGEGKGLKKLMQLVKKMGLDDKVELVPSVPHERIQDYYAQADIFALSSHHEGFCMPVLEAMASGLAIVASRIPAISEILAEAGITVENNPEAFREPLSRLIADKQLRQSYGERAKVRALTLDASQMEAKEKQLYELLLAKDKTKRPAVKVCYFGYYDPAYPRNRMIIEGLRLSGITVNECNALGQRHNPLRMHLELFRQALKNPYDVMIVGALSSGCIFLAYLLTKCRLKKKMLIYDAFFSKYDTVVFDKKIYPPGSLKARLYWLLDKLTCVLADKIIVDSQSHKNYFQREFKIAPRKIYPVYVGAEEDIFSAAESAKKNQHFNVTFTGSFVPLQGAEFIVRAAALLKDRPDVRFTLVGNGMLYERIFALSKELGLDNIAFTGWIDYRKMPFFVGEADICLGVFGEGEKAKRIIPIKAYQALAMAKALITGDSPAAREILQDRENVLFCRMADPQALAEAIVTLKEDRALREKIARNGYELFVNRFTKKAIGKRVSELWEA
ncbi:MAG: glycosyltransferase [Candidatus Omnitrophota bacterium]